MKWFDRKHALFFTFLSFFSNFTSSMDILTATQFLSNGQTLLSANQVFELGFFSPGNSNNWYVGIWYKRIPVKTYVWVANRDNPLKNSSGIFKIYNQRIVVLDQEKNLVWSSNQTSSATPVIQLLDTGNLVLREKDMFLWQSFDYPTDTLLPDMKLGWDRKTGLNRYLSAWRSPDDPASGDVSFKLDYNGFPECFLRKNQEIEYRSGPWNGLRFSGVPEMKKINSMSFGFVDNQNEAYYSFHISPNRSFFSRLTISSTGILQRYTWILEIKQWNSFWYAPKDQCDKYRVCGPYGICDANASPVCKCLRGFVPKNPPNWILRDGSDGCVRRTALDHLEDKFLHLKNMKLPESTTSFVDRKMGLHECASLCLRNYSCTAYANANITEGGSGCVLWFLELFDMRQYTEGGQDLYVRLAASDIGNGGRVGTLIIGIAVGGGIVLLGLAGCLVWKKKKNLKSVCIGKSMQKGFQERSQELSLHSGERSVDEVELPLFDLYTIARATDNFSDENELGQGGFGCVYKGTLVGDQEVAVKRLSKNSGQGIEEFKNEVRLIARLQHRNLVRLLGCCVDMDEKMLVYEYMEHKSLDFVIFNSEHSSILNWQRRFNIICGVARGLLYLHQDSRFRIIHRDLKASNILLDSEWNPKISDFGMARIFGGDQTEANTKRVVGTYGYMSPEYAMDGVFSVKSDVFSFGVLVLEIVVGQKNRRFFEANNEINLLGHVWKQWKERNGLKLLDEAVGDLYSPAEVLRCLQVGLLCVQERAEDRPTMASVLLMLVSESATLPQPKTPGFCLGPSPFETESSSSKQDESLNKNQLTVTELVAR